MQKLLTESATGVTESKMETPTGATEETEESETETATERLKKLKMPLQERLKKLKNLRWRKELLRKLEDAAAGAAENKPPTTQFPPLKLPFE